MTSSPHSEVAVERAEGLPWLRRLKTGVDRKRGDSDKSCRTCGAKARARHHYVCSGCVEILGTW